MSNINFIKSGVLLLFTLLFATHFSYAQKFEAENATLSGGATISASSSASGGYYVQQKDGNLTFEIELSEETFYNIYLNAASPSGDKTNIFSIDGASIEFKLTKNPTFQDFKLVSSLKLSAGTHTVEILKSWGWIYIDFIEFEIADTSERFDVNKGLNNPNATTEAKKLYQFLYDNYGEKIISGAMMNQNNDELEWLKTNTGKEPALIGIDFIFTGRGYSWYDDNKPVRDTRAFYNRNGIVVLSWHWPDPLHDTNAFYTDETDFDVSKIFDEDSPEYAGIISDIDYTSELLKQLQNDSVPVLWRPLHEASGGWFWWGAKGAEPCKQLWLLMYDRMVNYHGLNNLIWVWTRMPGDDDWYPGDDYVDIVGRDIYKEGDHSSQILEFNNTNDQYANKKIVALTECGSFPDPDNLITDGAAWSYFMPWDRDFITDGKYNPLDLWNKTLHHDYVITLDEMPDLKSYPIKNDISRKVSFKIYGDDGNSVFELDHAEITINGYTFYTDTLGNAYTNVDSGLVSYYISKNGYYKNTQFLVVTDTLITDTLIMQPFDVTFIVKNSDEEFVDNCLISVAGNDKYTNETGEAVFNNIPPDFSVELSKLHYNYKTVSFSNISSDTTLNLYLERTKYLVEFNILNIYTGQGIWEATVTTGEISKITGSNGRVFFELPAGDYPINISEADYKGIRDTITISSDSLFQYELNPAYAYVKFKLKKGTSPVNNAEITIAGQIKTSSSLGIATFYSLYVDSQYVYSIIKEGYNTYEGELFLRKDTTLNLNMVETNSEVIDGIYHHKLWPNPANKLVNIEVNSNIKPQSMFVFNSVGELQKNKIITDGKFITVDISNLANGPYYIQIITEKKTINLNFIKN